MEVFQGNLVLGIETSCDETSASVVEKGRYIRSNIVASQVDLHKRFGGVVPEVASRKHVELIVGIVEEALVQAGIALDELSGVSVTKGPGLVGGLLVGVAAAKAIAFSQKLPLIGVNHVEGHIYANFLAHRSLVPPAVCLTVSGGHTDLLYIEDYGRYEILGRTRDDAAGEAFDKVARVLGLGYPGGPVIDRLSREGDCRAFSLPKVMPGSLDFSFSGLKTAVLNIINGYRQKNLDIPVTDLAASFQRAVVDTLVERTISASIIKQSNSIMLSGGVAANSELRARLSKEAENIGKQVYYPTMDLCTDNAAMIACAGYYRLLGGERSDMSLNAIPGLKLL